MQTNAGCSNSGAWAIFHEKLLLSYGMLLCTGEKAQVSFTTDDVTDKDALKQIRNIAHRLEARQEVVMVAKQMLGVQIKI